MTFSGVHIKTLSLVGMVQDYTFLFFFSCRQWEDAEMLYLLQQMYKDLNLTEIFNIEVILPKVTLFKQYQSQYLHL